MPAGTPATKLSAATLDRVPRSVARPAYAVDTLGIGIVHLGIGAFHRAHQAMYTDDALGQVPGTWGICGVSLRSPDVRDRMMPQDGLYTAIEKSPAGVRRRSSSAATSRPGTLRGAAGFRKSWTISGWLASRRPVAGWWQ